MTNHLIKPFAPAIILSVILLTVTCCDRRSDTWQKMDLVENMINDKPDSALFLLDKISKDLLKSERENARYALLKSMALDKNYIDTTTCDVLQPAIDYYAKNGTPDEKLRTYYYQGRIYQNQGDDDSAMKQFMNAADLKEDISDSLLLARNHVALGSIYYKQYDLDKFIENNKEASKIYRQLGKEINEIKSLSKVISGYIMLKDSTKADSLISICKSLVSKNNDGDQYLFTSLLSYTIVFGSQEEIKSYLSKYQNNNLSQDDALNFAEGYSRIGDFEKALNILSDIKIKGRLLDSLKYITIKLGIYERKGDYENAFKILKEYTSMFERYQLQLMSQDILFADKKHKLEMKSLIDIQNRDRIIWHILFGISCLIMLSVWLYYRAHLNSTKRILAEKENENLKNEKINLYNQKEKAEIERDRKANEAKDLENENKRLEAEQLQRELEASNLLFEKKQLENERDNLKELLKVQTELSKPIQEIIKSRLEILNSLLAKEITNNDNYAKPYNQWIESIRSDKKTFMNSTRLAFKATHANFIQYLEDHGLDEYEINYVCLYAIGLRGKEVGEYMKLKRHYNTSSEIRKKLGIDEHETNLGLYIRRKMNNL